MASIEVRFKNGDTDEWELHEAMDLRELVKKLTRGTASGMGVVSLGVRSEGGGAADYDFVGLSMGEVVSWQIRGLFDVKADAALWQELQGLGE
jgi:hypothetical protein